jgi:hypothetical protein
LGRCQLSNLKIIGSKKGYCAFLVILEGNALEGRGQEAGGRRSTFNSFT